MFYECVGMDVTPIITKINSKLPTASQISASASADEIAAAIDTILKPIADLVKTKATTTIPDSPTTQQIVDGLNSIRVSVAMTGMADFVGDNNWMAILQWNGLGNTGSANSSAGQTDRVVSRTESFKVF